MLFCGFFCWVWVWVWGGRGGVGLVFCWLFFFSPFPVGFFLLFLWITLARSSIAHLPDVQRCFFPLSFPLISCIKSFLPAVVLGCPHHSGFYRPECRIPAFLVIFKWKLFGTFDHSVAVLWTFSVLLFSSFWGGNRDTGLVKQDDGIFYTAL